MLNHAVRFQTSIGKLSWSKLC